MAKSRKSLIFASLLFIASIYQVWQLSPQVIEDLLRIRKDVGQSGLWRGANFSQNQRFANFVKYLHANVPPDSRVILPSRETGLRAAATTPFMQFFLAPREVLNCLQPIIDCIEMHSNDHTYFLVLDAASIQNATKDLPPERLMQFDRSWGVYGPANPSTTNQSPLQTFGNAGKLLSALLWPGVWLTTMVTIGLLITQQLKIHGDWLTSIGIAYGMSLGAFTLTGLILMLLGFPFGPILIIFITIMWLVISLFWWFFTGNARLRLRPRTWVSRSTFNTIDAWSLIFLLFALVATILSVGKGYHASDAIVLWGAKGYGIASRGLISGASTWGTSTTQYPLHVPILIAAFKVLFGEMLPASKLIFPLYYFALLGMIYAYLKNRIPGLIAGLTTSTLASTPLLFRHAQIAYANLPFTFYFLSAVLISLQAINDTSETSRTNRFFLGGVFFVFSAWTRPEGILITIITLLLIILLAAPQIRPIFRKTVGPWTAAPVAIFSVLWFVVSGQIYTKPVQNTGLFSNALSHILAGDLHLGEAGYILEYLARELVSPTTWGVVGTGLLLFALAGILSRGTGFFSPGVLSGLLFFVVMICIYYLTSFDGTHDISWWVSTGLNRMVMPGVALLWVGSAESLFNRNNQS